MNNECGQPYICSVFPHVGVRRQNSGCGGWGVGALSWSTVQHLNNLTSWPCVWLPHMRIKHLHNHQQPPDGCTYKSQCVRDTVWGGYVSGGGGVESGSVRRSCKSSLKPLECRLGGAEKPPFVPSMGLPLHPGGEKGVYALACVLVKGIKRRTQAEERFQSCASSRQGRGEALPCVSNWVSNCRNP